MPLQAAREKFGEYISGEAIPSEAFALLHSLFPEDFEHYTMALEIVNNTTGVTTDRFIFPVLPDNISIVNTKVTNVRKTAQGVSVMNNNSFIPIDIKIDGTFGRKFKLMIGSYETNAPSPFTGNGGMIPSIPFALTVKTGYGALKMMERLYEKSTRSVNGTTNTLILYNMTYNQQYVVKLLNLQSNQGVSENMIWKYSLSMQAVSPANTGIGQRAVQALKIMGFAAVNTRISETVVDLTMDAFNEHVPPVT